MPEEIGIAVIVLLVAGWLFFLIVRSILKLLGETHDSLALAIAKRATQRHARSKSKFAQHVHLVLPDEIKEAEHQLEALSNKLRDCRSATVWKPARPPWIKKDFSPLVLSRQSGVRRILDIADIPSIVCPDETPWLEKESAILQQDCSYPFAPPERNLVAFGELSSQPVVLKEAVFTTDHPLIKKKAIDRFFSSERDAAESYNTRRQAILSNYQELNKQIETWNKENRERWGHCKEISASMAEEELANFTSHAQQYAHDCHNQKTRIRAAAEGFRLGVRDAVISRTNFIIGSLTLPVSVPRLWDIDFDEDQKILIVEVGLPDVVHHPPVKTIRLKSGPVQKPLNQSEKKEYIPKVHPAILLRLAYELFRNDNSDTVKLLVLNGWIRFHDPATGLETKAYTASLMLERFQTASLNLRNLDPVTAFQNLNGKSAGRLIEIIPIEPSLNLKRVDSRFVAAKAVLNTLGSATNLAAMEWQDFEHLIRELFEKEFSGRGAEVKITQASRDRGVDAIAFDPDPIHGGKYVIQAKRYTNTVDVSAVRDLCAVVRKEGASRGILVTTSTYGADAYAFANNEPVTLLNGAELLGLLKKHGYGFRINLDEARNSKLSGTQDKAPRQHA